MPWAAVGPPSVPGTGITHAEFNLEDEDTTLFQIWILPEKTGEAPGWGQREFPRGDREGSWVTVASGEPRGLFVRFGAQAWLHIRGREGRFRFTGF